MIFEVTIFFGNDYGYLHYDEQARTAEVHLANEEKKQEVIDYLATAHQIMVPPEEGLVDFSSQMIDPLADMKSFKTAITRLWNHTRVQVAWSHPVEYAKTHPTAL